MAPTFPRPPRATFAHFPQLRHSDLSLCNKSTICHMLPGETSFSRSTAATHLCQLRTPQKPNSVWISLSNALKYIKVHIERSADRCRSPCLHVPCFQHCRRRQAQCSHTLKHSSFLALDRRAFMPARLTQMTYKDCRNSQCLRVS